MAADGRRNQMSENSGLRSITAMLPRRALRAAGCIALLAASACSQFPATASVKVPPIPAGEARVWFYRDDGPYDSQVSATVRLNDAVVEELEPRGAFYRDVPPGHYHVAVDSYIRDDKHSTRDINLDPGQQAYFKILSSSDWAGGGLSYDPGSSHRVFDVWLMPATVAQSEMANSPFYGAR
jgi:hypothetical protein